MIKIPATDAGLTALTALVASGINVNLTLLFSRKQTLKAYAAYTAGLTQLAANGGNLAPASLSPALITRWMARYPNTCAAKSPSPLPKPPTKTGKIILPAPSLLPSPRKARTACRCCGHPQA